MRTREYRYLLIKKASNNSKGCGEFPYFGASYPDATCIDSALWDLDKGDDEGLYGGGEIPCPFCNTKEFIIHHEDALNGRTIKMLSDYVIWLRKKY